MSGLDGLMLHGHSHLPRKFPVSVLISLKSGYLALLTIISILLLFPNQLCTRTVNQSVDDAPCYRFVEVSNDMQGASGGHQGIQLILQDRFLQIQRYGRILGLSAAERSGATCDAGPSIATLGILMSVKEFADHSQHATSGLTLRATWCRSGTPSPISRQRGSIQHVHKPES